MYLSKFLLNRQKILEPCAMNEAISSYFGKKDKYLYRLEWYRIGVSVPLKVISDKAPGMKLMPECQLYETSVLPELPAKESFKFSLFAVPEFADSDNACDNEEKLLNWLNEQLDGAATAEDCTFGPNNCLYYVLDGAEKHQQTVTINGTLKVNDLEKLEKLRCKIFGKYRELGCGFLDIK